MAPNWLRANKYKRSGIELVIIKYGFVWMNKYNLLQSLVLLLGSVKETLLGSSLAELML